MARLQSLRQEETPNLAILAAIFAIRRPIRTFLRRDGQPFVALLRVPDADDAFVYEEAARRLLRVGETYDEFGNDISYVSKNADLDTSPWKFLSRLKHVRQAVILFEDGETVSDEIRLLADFEADLERPDERLFAAAARELKLPGLTVEQARFLAGQSLRNVQLAMPRGRPFVRAINGLKRQAVPANGPDINRSENLPNLHTLAGYGEAKSWGLQLAVDLADWKAGVIGWEDVDRGVLLHGPPGCGKTMFASALAHTCGIPLLMASAARWQSEGHLGDMLKSMRKFFASAAKKAPCIAFLDEFDSFGDRNSQDDSSNHDYKRQVINALLECLDPAEGRAGVVVVGATNSVTAVDPALLRAGRLEKTIAIALPGPEARVEILRHHLSGKVGDIDFSAVTTITNGWSGADLEKLARDARRLCRRRGGDKVSLADLMTAMPPLRRLTEKERFRVAVHEAGHALVSLGLGQERLVSIHVEEFQPEGDRFDGLGMTVFRAHGEPLRTEQELSDQIAVLLGGIAAEQIVFGGHTTGAGGDRSSDLVSATALATRMERNFAFGQSLASDATSDHASLQKFRMYDRELAGDVDVRLSRCHRVALDLLEASKDALLAVAETLVRKNELDTAEVVRLAGSHRPLDRATKPAELSDSV